MMNFARSLKRALQRETDTAIALCDPSVAKVLTQNHFTRNIPFQMELGFIFDIPDWGAVPSLMCGIPMVGHAAWVPGMLCRNKSPICSIHEVIGKAKLNNIKMITQAVQPAMMSWMSGHGKRPKAKSI